MQQTPEIPPALMATLGRAAPPLDAAVRASLARLIRDARAEIFAEWRSLLASRGLPYQRQAVQNNPASFAGGFDEIVDTVLAWLLADGDEAEAAAREAMRSLYRDYGWGWAQRENAAPDLAIDVPRICQAIWQVLLRHSAPAVNPTELLNRVVSLNILAMELAMARVSGYLNYKESVLTSQQETLARLIDELTRVETRQQRALALELHDNLAQCLASLFNGIQHCSHVIERDAQAAKGELQHLRGVASEALRDVRTMIRDLHFGVSSQDGRLSALVDYLADLDADTGIRHEANVPTPMVVLPRAQEALILRVIQEALSNAHKHARPSRIVVSVRTAPRDLIVEIRDDGRGFDVEDTLARSQRQGRLGLIGMRERADLLGGSLTIISAPGAGATILLTVPRSEGGA